MKWILLCLAPLAIGCSKPQLLLHDRGVVRLQKEEHVVRLLPEDELAISWELEGETYETASDSAPHPRPALVRVVEVNSRSIRLISESWKTLTDIPAKYRDSPIGIQPRSGRYQGPVLQLPLESLREIRLLRATGSPGTGAFSRSAKLAARGGLAGAVFMLGLAAPRHAFDLAHPKIDDGELLRATGAAVLAGGIIYPLYKIVRPERAKSFVSFRVNQPGGYQLIVEPR